jgi:hypothetical protein
VTSIEGPGLPEGEPRPERASTTAARPVDLEVEYIKAMIDWTKDDVRQVYLRVTAAIGIAVLVLTQLPFEKLAELDRDGLFLAALGLLLGSAALHFLYLSRVHRSRRDLAGCLRTAAGDAAQEIWRKLWHNWWWSFQLGDLLLVSGLIVVGVVVGDLLALSPTPGDATK